MQRSFCWKLVYSRLKLNDNALYKRVRPVGAAGLDSGFTRMHIVQKESAGKLNPRIFGILSVDIEIM